MRNTMQQIMRTSSANYEKLCIKQRLKMDLWSLDDDKLSVTLHQRPPHTAKVTATAVTFYMCPPIAAVTFLCSYTSGLVFLRRGLCPVAQEPPCQPPGRQANVEPNAST